MEMKFHLNCPASALFVTKGIAYTIIVDSALSFLDEGFQYLSISISNITGKVSIIIGI